MGQFRVTFENGKTIEVSAPSGTAAKQKAREELQLPKAVSPCRSVEETGGR